MRLIVFANTKGGVSKSSLAANLAAHYASEGLRVWLADTDPKHCAAQWASRRGAITPALPPVHVASTTQSTLARTLADARTAAADVVLIDTRCVEDAEKRARCAGARSVAP